MTKQISLVVFVILATTAVTVTAKAKPQGALCSGFPWTSEWQNCFQSMMNNIRKKAVDTIKKSAVNGGSGSSFSSSSTSSSGGTSSSSITIGKSKWTVRASGLGISTSTNNGKFSLQSSIGTPESFHKKISEDKGKNELRIDLIYPSDSKIAPKWLTVTAVNGPSVSKLKINRSKAKGQGQGDLLTIESP